MSMTRTRERVYNRSWYRRECRFDMKRRRREYNRKIRHSKITEDSSAKEYKMLMKLCWDTVS